MSELARALKEIGKEATAGEKIYSTICEVLSVDESARTCQLQPINGDAERKGRIQASLSLSEGIFIKPVVGSYVQLTYINNITGIITSYSKIEEFNIIIGSSRYNITDGDIVFNNGSDNAVRFSELKSGFDELKTDFNNFISQQYNIHTHAGVFPGTSSTAVTTSIGTPSQADISNSKVDEIKLP